MQGVKVTEKNDYCIVSAFEEDAEHLTFKVQELIDEGWTLSGGISSSNSKLFQALKKLEK